MKKLIFAAGAMIIAAAVSVIVSRDTRDSFFEANVEALADAENDGTPVETCYTKCDDFEVDQSLAIFCDERTTDNMIYPCQSQYHDRKGVPFLCTKKK